MKSGIKNVVFALVRTACVAVICSAASTRSQAAGRAHSTSAYVATDVRNARRLQARGEITEDGPEIWEADLGTHLDLPPCTKTSFTQLPIWSPRGDSYLIEERDRSHVKSNGSGEKFNVILVNTKHKTRMLFHDADAPAWSPDGRWILLVNCTPDRQIPYLRIANSRSGKERTFTATMSSAAENHRYGWKAATFNGAGWLADSEHLLMGVTAARWDGAQIGASFVVSSKDGSRSLMPGIYPLSGSRDGRTILIQRPDKKLFLLDLAPKLEILNRGQYINAVH